MTYLEQLFNKFNKDYFDGAMPHMDIYFAGGHIKEWGWCSRFSIVLSAELKNYQLALEGVVLHEMVHAYLDEDDHTARFYKLEKKLNKRHFGNPSAHKIHFANMIRDLRES